MRGGSRDVPAMVTVPASASLNVMTGDDSMSDDVFEVDDVASTAVSSSLTTGEPLTTTPSPTGYRDYKPPAEVFTENYGYTSRNYDSMRSSLKRPKEDDSAFTHKTILLGDSGVGKTSLLVQFDTGKFQPGNFAATVGIGFTVRARPMFNIYLFV
ncbi:Ras-related protein Rab-26 [Anthophora retusa]